MPRLPHPPATPALTPTLRAWSGWLAAAAGAVLCILGWYGISGEGMAEQQLPYLASATIPGAALIVAGAVLIARPTQHTDDRIETLYALLVADGPAPAASRPAPPPAGSALFAVPGGTLYHRRDCPLVADKPTAEPVDAIAVAERSLTPCPVCEPPAPPGPDLPASDPDQALADRPTTAPTPAEPAPSQPAGSSRSTSSRPAADPHQAAADRPGPEPAAPDPSASPDPAPPGP